MKKIIYSALGVFLFISCTGPTTPIIGDPNNPFIVKKIEEIRNTRFSCYTGDISNGFDLTAEFVFPRPSSVIMKTGLYNIGDTIK
jgi:hypothetical protein